MIYFLFDYYLLRNNPMNENKGQISLLGEDPVGTHTKRCKSPWHAISTTIWETTHINDLQEREQCWEMGGTAGFSENAEIETSLMQLEKHARGKKNKMMQNCKYYEEGNKDCLLPLPRGEVCGIKWCSWIQSKMYFMQFCCESLCHQILKYLHEFETLVSSHSTQ